MEINKVFIIGVGMTKFEKPCKRENFDYPEMAKEAVTKALNDANLSYSAIKQACVGYMYGDSTCGQRALYQFGMTGIPIINVHNNGATGSSTIYLAKQLVDAGSECVLALGFEKMERGRLTLHFLDRTNPLDKHIEKLIENVGMDNSPITAQFYGSAGIEHMKKYGTKSHHFAKIGYKNHKHSTRNPYAQFQDEYTLHEIQSSPQVFGPLTKLQCCPPSDGSAAVILANEEFVIRHNLKSRAIEILGMEMATDPESSLSKSMIKVVGFDMTALAAKKLFEKTGLKPEQVNVVELHDCFSANELVTYEALGLCPVGGAGKFIDDGDNTYGGRCVVNPSGGLISRGNPLGATGISQCIELVWQLRGEAGERQVPGASLALHHNIGLGGAVVVALYRKGFTTSPVAAKAVADSPEGFKAHRFMKILESTMQQDNYDNIIKQVQGIYGFNVKNGPGGSECYWVININEGKGKITFNRTESCDATFIMNDKDVEEIISGNSQKAYFQGKLQIIGDVNKGIRLLYNVTSPIANKLISKL